jgi:hypothetical protein
MYLVNDILLSGRYLDASISPMTLPMVKNTKIIVTDSTYEALPDFVGASGMSAPLKNTG